MLYHDALIVMTAQDCKDWMKTQPIGNKGLTFYDKWILPLHGLNDDISQYSAGNPSVTSIEVSAFIYCTAFVQVKLHEGLQRIGDWEVCIWALHIAALHQHPIICLWH